jgi:hypothetical protein
MRLAPRFDTLQAAIRYATEQGLRWVGAPAPEHSTQH